MLFLLQGPGQLLIDRSSREDLIDVYRMLLTHAVQAFVRLHVVFQRCWERVPHERVTPVLQVEPMPGRCRMDEHDLDLASIPRLVHITGAIEDTHVIAVEREVVDDDVTIAREVICDQDGAVLLPE